MSKIQKLSKKQALKIASKQFTQKQIKSIVNNLDCPVTCPKCHFKFSEVITVKMLKFYYSNNPKLVPDPKTGIWTFYSTCGQCSFEFKC